MQCNSKYIFLLHLQCHLCSVQSTFVLNFCLGVYSIFMGFLQPRFGLGGGGRGMSAGGACEDDELVRDPFCRFPWYSQVLIPSAKAVLNADAPLASWIFPFLESGRRNDCVLAVHKPPMPWHARVNVWGGGCRSDASRDRGGACGGLIFG